MATFFRKNINFSRYSVIQSVYITLVLIFSYNIFNAGITGNYNREVGASAVRNISIDTVIARFFSLYVIVIPLFFFLIWCGLSCFEKYIDNRIGRSLEKLWKLVSGFSMAAVLTLLLSYINNFGIANEISGFYLFLLTIIVSVYLYLVVRNKEEINSCDLKWIVLISINCSFFVQFLSVNISELINASIVYEIIFLVICTGLNKVKNPEKWKSAWVSLGFYIFMSAFTLEIIAILNQYGMIVGNATVILAILFLLLIFIALICWKQKRACNYDEMINWGILLAGVFMAGLPEFQSIVQTDLFEQANNGVSFSQLVLFDKIPIIESVSAHLGSDWLPNIIYYILNQDYTGAIFSPYRHVWSIIYVLVLYGILKHCIEKDFALLLCLFVPFSNSGWRGLGLISIYAIVILANKVTWKNAVIFWNLLAASILYQADTGLALGIGSVLAYFGLKMFKRQKIEWRKMLISFLGVAAFYVLCFSSICVIKDINIVDRAKEFLDLFGSSNQIWAYGNFGQAGNLQFTIVYFFVPVLVVFLLIYFIYAITKGKICVSDTYSMVTLAFGFAYIINMQRILVRHNYLEQGFSLYMIFTASVFIALILNARVKKLEYLVCICVLGLFSIFFNIDDISIGNTSVVTAAYDRIDNGNIVAEYNVKEKVQRVAINSNMKEIYEDVVEEINWLLDDNETFLDFSNQSLLYSLAKKESPVYIVQSPSFLSTELTQEYFIEQLQKHSVPIAISTIGESLNAGIGLDGVLHSYRTYLVSEYLNKNYIPIETVDSFVIWVKNDRNDLIEKIESTYEYLTVDNITWCNDAEVSRVGEGLKIKAGKTDPFICDIFVKTSEDSEEFIVNIKYKSNINGRMQLFYKSALEESYSETKSLWCDITYEGVASFALNSQEAKYIRLDFPVNSQFEIENMVVTSRGRILSGYNYGTVDRMHSHNLGAIPYLWGNYDYKESYNRDVLYKCEEIEKNLYSIECTRDSAYLAVTISSDIDTVATVLLGDLEEQLISKINFTHDIYTGEYTYLFRVSADSLWYEGSINAVQINLPEGCKVTSVELLEGDGYDK